MTALIKRIVLIIEFRLDHMPPGKDSGIRILLRLVPHVYRAYAYTDEFYKDKKQRGEIHAVFNIKSTLYSKVFTDYK